MGCAVEKTDTGIECEVHKFDTRNDAILYLSIHRGYVYNSCDSWGFDMIQFYKGPKEGQRASLRKRGGYWSVAFW